jgi:transposase
VSQKLNTAITVVGIDIGKNSFHVVGLDQRGAIALRQKWSRGQVEARLANVPPCLIGMEACTGAHHLSRKLQALGHDARLMPSGPRGAVAGGRAAPTPRPGAGEAMVKPRRIALYSAQGGLRRLTLCLKRMRLRSTRGQVFYLGTLRRLPRMLLRLSPVSCPW